MTGTLRYLDRLLTRRKGARAFPRISRRPIDHIQLNKLGLADSIDQGRLHCQVGKLALVQRAWLSRHQSRKNMPVRKSLMLCFMLDLDCTGLTQLLLGTPASCWLPPGWRCSRLRKSCAIGDRSPSAQFAVENHKFPFGKPNFFRFGRAPRGYPEGTRSGLYSSRRSQPYRYCYKFVILFSPILWYNTPVIRHSLARNGYKIT